MLILFMFAVLGARYYLDYVFVCLRVRVFVNILSLVRAYVGVVVVVVCVLCCGGLILCVDYVWCACVFANRYCDLRCGFKHMLMLFVLGVVASSIC